MTLVVYKDESAQCVITANEHGSGDSRYWTHERVWTISDYENHLREGELQSFPPAAVATRMANLPEMPPGMAGRILQTRI